MSEKEKLRIFIENLSELSNEDISPNQLREKFQQFIKKLKAEHDYLLYFNPKLPTLFVDPHLLNNSF